MEYIFQEKGEKGDANETDINERKAEPSRIPVEALDNIEDSDSEPEGMCGTLPMFSGKELFQFRCTLNISDHIIFLFNNNIYT